MQWTIVTVSSVPGLLYLVGYPDQPWQEVVKRGRQDDPAWRRKGLHIRPSKDLEKAWSGFHFVGCLSE